MIINNEHNVVEDILFIMGEGGGTQFKFGWKIRPGNVVMANFSHVGSCVRNTSHYVNRMWFRGQRFAKLSSYHIGHL